MSTPNVNLNQWDKSDRILMEDFNADNFKLDQILGEAHDRAGFKLIAEAVLEAEADTLELSLADLDWGQYAVVCLDYAPLATASGSIAVILGGGHLVSMTSSILGNVATDRNTAQIWLFPFYMPQRKAYVSTCGMTEEKHQSYGNPYTIITRTRIQFESSSKLSAGSLIRVWGMK